MYFIFCLNLFISIFCIVMVVRNVEGEVDFFSMDEDRGFFAILVQRDRLNARGKKYHSLLMFSLFVAAVIKVYMYVVQ